MANDWKLLSGLRAGFLGGAPGTTLADYWRTEEHLAAYDATFAQRIGWKWRAVLEELARSGFQFPERYALHDFGTGTGIAPRTFFTAFPREKAASVHLADRSERAVAFARAHLPGSVGWNPENGFAGDPAVLLISHVLTELDDQARTSLVELAAKAHTVLWVEPGTSAVSRALIGVREHLRGIGGVKIIAPCPHQGACGMLSPGNERHWCHMFAKPPAAASQSAFWAEFGKAMDIDLRALPVSYLVTTRDLEKSQVVPEADARVIGRAREYKGYLKILACDDDAVHEATVQKRDDKARFKELGRGAFTAAVPKAALRRG
jgi:hypothetical protein